MVNIHDRKKPVIPAVDGWKASLQQEPTLSSSQWKTLYSPLVSNKQGDANWKIAHQVLPTALSLSRMGTLSTPNCHRCGAIDNIEHAMLECRAVHGFWGYVWQFIRKTSENKLVLSPALKILGKVPAADDPFSERTVASISWALTVARCAIFKSANHHRLNNSCVPPEAIFKASIKAHFKISVFIIFVSQFKAHLSYRLVH